MLKEEYLKLAMLVSLEKNLIMESYEDELQRKNVALSIKGHEDIWFNVENYRDSKNDTLNIRNVYYKKNNIIYHQYAYNHPLFTGNRGSLFLSSRDLNPIEQLLIDAKQLMNTHIEKLETLAKVIHDNIGYDGKHGLVFGSRYRNIVIPMTDKENRYIVDISFRKNRIEPWSLWLLKNDKVYWVDTQYARKSMDVFIKNLEKKDHYSGEYNLPAKIFSELNEKQLKNNCKDEAIVV